MTELSIRNKIDRFEELLMEQPVQLDVKQMQLKHYFTPNGLYARELLIPAGVVLTGKIKKHDYLTIISAGFITEVTEEGSRHIKGPHTSVSAPGTKRIFWAHTDSLVTTVHKVSCQSVAEAEEELIAVNYDDVFLEVF